MKRYLGVLVAAVLLGVGLSQVHSPPTRAIAACCGGQQIEFIDECNCVYHVQAGGYNQWGNWVTGTWNTPGAATYFWSWWWHANVNLDLYNSGWGYLGRQTTNYIPYGSSTDWWCWRDLSLTGVAC